MHIHLIDCGEMVDALSLGLKYYEFDSHQSYCLYLILYIKNKIYKKV
jgi:hypothetical protein